MNSSLIFLENAVQLYKSDKEVNMVMLTYYEWQLSQAKSIQLSSYKDIPEITELIEHTLKYNPPVQKGCYEAAMWTTLNSNGKIDYVEGMISNMIPINHAWNVYKDIHFDLVSQVVWKNTLHFSDYQQIIRLNYKQVNKYVSDLGTTGEYIGHHYQNEVLGNP